MCSTRTTLITGFIVALTGCAGSSGGDSDPPPTLGQISLSSSASNVTSGDSVTLTWSGSDISSCNASDGWSGSRSNSGSEDVGPLSSDTTFTLTCSSPGGQVSDSVLVTVSALPGPTVSLSANPQTVVAGGSSTLSWSSANATNCTAMDGWSGTRNLSGSEDVGPIDLDTTFTLECTNGSTTVSSSTTVSIRAASQAKYATYFGGISNDFFRDVAVGPDGSIYVAGGAESNDFPTQNAYDSTFNGVHDVVVAKFSSSGVLVWSTFIGGPNYDRAYAIEVDNNGDVYVAGRAGSGYLTTVGVVQPTFGGDIAPNNRYGQQDGFVTKLTTAGQVLWSTFLGGDDLAFIRDIDIDSSGNVYFSLSQVSSSNSSVTHLISPGSFQTSHAGGTDGIVAKLTSDGTAIEWGTYLGGSGDDNTNPSVRVDPAGNVLVAGHTNSSDMPVNGSFGSSNGGQLDMHITKFLPDGSDIVYAAYVGGSSNDAAETHALAVDGSGNAYVAAGTSSGNFPVTSGVLQTVIAGGNDAFITKISPTGDLVASTYFGGSGNEYIEGISIDASGDVIATGVTDSDDLPVSVDAGQPSFGGASDGFIARISDDLSTLHHSTFFGGSDYDLIRSSWSSVSVAYFVGHTNSSDLPVTDDAFDLTLNGSPNTGNKFTGDAMCGFIDLAQP